jgi:adenylate kinase family enzyme
VTGEPLSQREDDRTEVVRRRLLDYQAMTAPLLGYYRDTSSSSSSSASDHHQSPQLKVAEFRGSQSDLIYPQVKDFLDRLL